MNTSTLSSSKLFFFEVQLQTFFSLIIKVGMKEMHIFSIIISRQISGFIANSRNLRDQTIKNEIKFFVDEI